MGADLFAGLTLDELILLEDMMLSAEEKTFDVYGLIDPLYRDTAEVWADVRLAYLRERKGIN